MDAEHRLGDERIRELAGKVEVRVSEELDELCRLFHWLVDPLLGAGRAGRLVELVRGLEALSSVRELIELAGTDDDQP